MITFTEHEQMVVTRMAARKTLVLGKRPVTADLLASDLVSDAFVLKAFPIWIDRWNEWTIVSSPIDWISDNLIVSVRSSFFLHGPFPEKGHETFRCNIFLATFCEHVVTYSIAGEKEIIKGREDLSELELYLSTVHAGKRVVAFSGIVDTDLVARKSETFSNK